MRIYSVYEPPWTRGGPEAAVLVGEGFTAAAFLFGPLWALAHAAVREGLIQAGILIALLAALGLSGAGALAHGIALAAYALHCGFAANGWRRAALARRGWRESGVVSGRGRDEAERRYFAAAGAP